MKYYIYALCEPEGLPEVRYIGKTKNPCGRLREHHNVKLLKPRTHKNDWIKSLLARGTMARMLILFECQSNEEAIAAEVAMIAYCKDRGFRLTNGSAGGDGGRLPGFKLSTEKRAHLSKVRLGRKHSEEAKKVIGEKAKGRPSPMRKLTPEQAESIRTEYASGQVSQRELGRKYGVSEASVCAILSGKRYKKKIL